MATSGSLTLTTSNQYILGTIAWSLTSQSVTDNNSVISWTLSFRRTSSYSGGTSRRFVGNIVINGVTTSLNTSIYNFNTTAVQFASGTATIPHNADGTKTFTISGSGTLSGGATGSNYTVNSGSDSWALTTIPRATQPSLSSSSVTMGNSVTISTSSRASSSFTHTLTYKCGSASGTIATGVNTSYTWTVPTSLASQVTTSTSGTCTITCTTYSGSTAIGSKTATLTVGVPSSVVPTITGVSITDPTGNLATYGTFVQGKSKVKIQVTSSGASGSTISKTTITALGTTTTTNPYESNILSVSGTQNVSVVVTDSRGRNSEAYSTSFSVANYINPTISRLAVSRCDSDGTPNDDGGYIIITHEGEIAPINNGNSKTWTLKYKRSSDAEWTTIWSNTDTYQLTGTTIVVASADYTFDVMLSGQDDFSTTSRSWSVSSAFTLMDFNASGKGVSFGKVSEDDIFEVAMPMYQNVDNTLYNVEAVEIITNQFGIAKKYANGYLECIREVTISNLNVATAWGSIYTGQDTTYWSFAHSFIEVPLVQISVRTSGGQSAWHIGWSATSVDRGGVQNIAVARATTSPNVSVTATIRAFGRWK